MPRIMAPPSGSSKRIISPLPPMLVLPSALPSPYLKSAGVLSAVASAGAFDAVASIAAPETMAAQNQARRKFPRSIPHARIIGRLLDKTDFQPVIVANP